MLTTKHSCFENYAAFGDFGIDFLMGGSGHDLIEGGAGIDFIFGGFGNDTLRGDGGLDLAFGGEGNDILDGGDEPDFLFGNGDVDVLYGGFGMDFLFGNANGDCLYGQDGLDFLFGGGSPDFFDGGFGLDLLLGGDGDDEMHGGLGLDLAFGGNGKDRIYGEDGPDLLFGGAQNDRLEGGDSVDLLFGGGGDDTLVGGSHLDLLVGGPDNDCLSGGNAVDVLVGGAGNDHLYGESDTGFLLGGAGNDQIYGGVARDFAFGGSGDDCLAGGGHTDFLVGGTGVDSMYGEDGNDLLIGRWDGGVQDVLSGNAGNDLLVGGGNDQLFGGAGADILLGGRNGGTRNYSLDVPPNCAPAFCAEICGFVWLDLNGNGVRDPGESGIAGVTVRVTGTYLIAGVQSPFSISTVTTPDDPDTCMDELGRYCLTGLPPSGAATVTIVLPGGHIQTFPVGGGGYTHGLPPLGAIGGSNFGILTCNNPLALVSASSHSNQITTVFTKPLHPGCLLPLSKYSLSPFRTVVGAALDPADPTRLILTTAPPLIPGTVYTLTVMNLCDLCDNALSAATTTFVAVARQGDVGIGTRFEANQMVIYASEPGVLQRAGRVDGTWLDVPSATMRYEVQPVGPSGFFRLRVP